jgi:hypothetical protein
MASVTRLATAANIPPIAWPVIVACTYCDGNKLARPNNDAPNIDPPATNYYTVFHVNIISITVIISLGKTENSLVC